jgi:hypothetical protein
MLRIVELDAQSKENVVYMVAIGEEKVGISEAELVELIKTKHARSTSRRSTAKGMKPIMGEATALDSMLPPMPMVGMGE